MSALEHTLTDADDAARECAGVCPSPAQVRAEVVEEIRARLSEAWGHVTPSCVDPGQVMDLLDDVEAGTR